MSKKVSSFAAHMAQRDLTTARRGGRGRRGALSIWLRQNEKEIVGARAPDQVSPPTWQHIAEAAAKDGVTSLSGKPYTAQDVRTAWSRMRSITRPEAVKPLARETHAPVATATESVRSVDGGHTERRADEKSGVPAEDERRTYLDGNPAARESAQAATYAATIAERRRRPLSASATAFDLNASATYTPKTQRKF